MALQLSPCSARARKQIQCVRNVLGYIRKTAPCLRSSTTVSRTVASPALADLAQGLQGAPADPEQTIQAVYTGLGLTLVSFILTFGVAPRFKSAFKEPETWQEIYEDFMSIGGVESVDAEIAAVKASKGTLLMDIRLNRKFEKSTIPNSQSFQLYQPISGWGLASNIRRAGFAFFGIYGTERNMQWLEEVQASVPKGTEIIVACDTGGSLEPKTGAETGFQSQSLKAAYFLKKAGYRNVKHLRGGISEYRRSVGPLVPGDCTAQAETAARQKSGMFK